MKKVTTRRQAIKATAAAIGVTGSVAIGATATPKKNTVAQQNENQPSLEGNLGGKVALVTGAARGIGRASALAMAREGADLLIFDLAEPNYYQERGSLGYPIATSEDFAETKRLIEADGRRCVAIKGDVREYVQAQKAVQTAIQELGKVDILHANAGILPRVPFTEVTDTLWSDCINTNLTGYGNFARAVVPHLIERGEGGRIIFTASTHGAQGSNERHVYTAAKWGVIGLAKSLALELSQHSILVNCVAPGFTNTGMANNEEMCGFLITVLLSLTSIARIESLKAQVSPPATTTNAAIYHFQLCQWQAMSVSDGTLAFPPSTLVPNAPTTEVAEALTADFLPPEELSLYINVLYLDTGDRQILIDTGSGTGQGAVGQLLANLNSGGVAAEDIDTVIITHAHPDHIGGIIGTQGEFNFPNAQYYLSENEWNFWTAATVEMPNSLLDEQTQQQMVATVKPILQQIGDRLTQFQPGEEIIPGIRAIDVSGHTPGQSAYAITADGEQLIATGDIFYSDPLNLEHPEWQVGYDADPVQGVATRKQMLAQFQSDRTLLLVPHMPFPGLGYVKAEGANYQWQPVAWQFEPL